MRDTIHKLKALNHIYLHVALIFLAIYGSCLSAAEPQGTALVLTVKDAIGPATSDYIHNGLIRAREEDASLVILRLDTPGGLDTSMRDIIRDILASPVPVATYVSPSGARAASAGTYILYASHVAAMAPGTNLGAATPVQIGGLPDLIPKQPEEQKEKGKVRDKVKDETQDGQESADETPEKPGAATDGGAADTGSNEGSHGDTMSRKMINDAVAYIRSLAELRSRNADWAEQAVRQAASLSAQQARDLGVVDVVAKDVQDLLNILDGRVVEVNNLKQTLRTADLGVEYFEPDWRSKFLSVITNPNVAPDVIGDLWPVFRTGQPRLRTAGSDWRHQYVAGPLLAAGIAGQLRRPGLNPAGHCFHDSGIIRAQLRCPGHRRHCRLRYRFRHPV